MTFRRRIIVAMVPLFALLVALGGTGTVLIYHLGNRHRRDSARELRQRDLHARPERGPGTHRLVVPVRAGRAGKGILRAIRGQLEAVRRRLSKEQHNITLPGEGELVDKLTTLSDRYRRQGDDFFKHAGQAAGQALLRRAERAGALRHLPRDQGRLRRDSADQPGQHGRGKPAGAPHGPFLPDLVRRRLGDRHCPGRVPRRQHDSHDPVPDSRRHRIGRGHRRGQPGSTRPRLLRG